MELKGRPAPTTRWRRFMKGLLPLLFLPACQVQSSADVEKPGIQCELHEGSINSIIVCENGIRAVVFRKPDGKWSAAGCYLTQPLLR